MISPLTIRLFQLNWFMALILALHEGLARDWTAMIVEMLLALAWAYLLQRFTDGEDLIASFLFRKKKNRQDPTS